MGEETRPGGDGAGRPGFDHHATNTGDHASGSPGRTPKPSQTISAPRRLTVAVPGDEAEACQFTNGVIMACWSDPPRPYVWRDLDALREQWPDAVLTWLDPETVPNQAPDAGPAPASVFVAEAVWFENDPVDGRERIAVGVTLGDALSALRDHGIYGGDLVATETTSGSALGTETARTWAVHERTEKPSDEGLLWITEEQLLPRAEAADA